MPITLSIPLRAKLLETKGWKPLFFCPPPLHTLPEGKGKGKEEKMLPASTVTSCTVFSCAVMASDDFFPVAEPVCARATLWGWKRFSPDSAIPENTTPARPLSPSHSPRCPQSLDVRALLGFPLGAERTTGEAQ